jgi:NAD(P)H-dependent flavin oxidoreductase YrpB (nitropropane dioxygenase family)
MPLDDNIRHRLSLPAVCAPMNAVTGPELVIEACKAGGPTLISPPTWPLRRGQA